MLIKVTQEHLEKGKTVPAGHTRCGTCPVALALNDAMPFVREKNGEKWIVNGEHAYLEGWEKIKTSEAPFVLPRKVRYLIKWFDAGLPVRPFEFEI